MSKQNATGLSLPPAAKTAARALIKAAVVELMEGRRLLAAQPFGGVVDGALVVNGTAGDDSISFKTKGVITQVRMNGVLAKFSTAAFTRIEVQAGDGNDAVDFSAMAMPCYVNLGTGNDLAYGGTGRDTLTGAAGKDTLYGSDGNDRLGGGATADQLFGGEGDDFLYGGDGDDTADGGGGRNHLFGEAGVDTLTGGSKFDAISGGDGSDKIYGLAGNDILTGDAGADKVYGGAGNDQITGGSGKDYLYGEAGDDTLDSADGVTDYAVDGGKGDDTVTSDDGLETPEAAETVDGVTPDSPDPDSPDVPTGGDLTRAVSFGDEALWDSNFDTAAADVKALGVKAVRVWFEVSSYDERPHAYDTVDTADIIYNWRSSTATEDRKVTAGLAMKRAFALKKMGFQVILTVSVHGGAPPASDQQVKDFYQYLLDAPDKRTGGTSTLRKAVDYWEVGQEVDIASNWNPSGTSKSDGLKSYVDQELLPAASVLHAGTDTSTWEKIISASVSYDPADVSKILAEAKAQNKLSAVDYAGYHPYGRYIVSSDIDEIKDRVRDAVAVSKKYDKPLAATEWNVRGYPTDGSKDAAWSQAIKTVYNSYIAPNFGISVYFSLVDNLDGRGGGRNVTARPAGLLKHDTTISVTPNSSTDDLETYYNSPLVENSLFFDVFDVFDTF